MLRVDGMVHGAKLVAYWHRQLIALLVVVITSHFHVVVGAQSTDIATIEVKDTLVIRSIRIEGNVRTRASVILRELTFRNADTLLAHQLNSTFQVSRNQLLNTGLFHEVDIEVVAAESPEVDVLIRVKERWYFLPLPALSLYDRNINVWWVEHQRDIRWLQLGLRLFFKNFSGRNDDLRLTTLFGFQQDFSLSYGLPYFDARLRQGIRFRVALIQGKRVAYDVVEDKERIYQNIDENQRKLFTANLDYFFRPQFHYRYIASVGFDAWSAGDTVIKQNPDYLFDSLRSVRYPYLRLTFVRDYRNLIAYPTQGTFLELSVSRKGLGLPHQLNQWSARAKAAVYVPLSDRWLLAGSTLAQVKFPGRGNYVFQRGLGYGNEYVAGYEYYAINGDRLAYGKLHLKYRLLQVAIPTAPGNQFTQGARLPISVYLKSFAEAGYVWQQSAQPSNSLVNTWLVSTGIGMDVVLIYDTSVRLHFAINRRNESGLYVHYTTYF